MKRIAVLMGLGLLLVGSSYAIRMIRISPASPW
jgi:hypothetical protein